MGRVCQHSDTRSDDPFETSVICDLGPSGRSGNSIDLVVAAATEREPPTAYHRLPFQYGHVAVVIGGLQYSMISGRVVLKPAGTILCMAVDPIDYSVIGALAVVPEAAIDPVYGKLAGYCPLCQNYRIFLDMLTNFLNSLGAPSHFQLVSWPSITLLPMSTYQPLHTLPSANVMFVRPLLEEVETLRAVFSPPSFPRKLPSFEQSK